MADQVTCPLCGLHPVSDDYCSTLLTEIPPGRLCADPGAPSEPPSPGEPPHPRARSMKLIVNKPIGYLTTRKTFMKTSW